MPISFFSSSHKLVRTAPLNFEQASKLEKLKDVYDFWRPAGPGRSTDIMVGPREQNYLYNLLKNLGIEFVEIINDIGDLIATQKSKVAEKSYQGKISFDTYYSHDDVRLYISKSIICYAGTS